MDKVSIIIPNYNNAKYLKDCIESVLKQSYRNLELIIVDDCSADNSTEIIKYYQKRDPRVKGLFFKKNVGVSDARNKGVEFSSGEYITFLDADDFYNNIDKIANEMKLIEKYREEKGKDIISYSIVTRVDEKGKYIDDQGRNKSTYLEGKIAIKLMAFYKNARPRDFCVRKEIFVNSGGYNDKLSFYEDFDLLIRLSMVADFYCTYEFGTAYRFKDTGLSKRPSIEHILVQNEIVKKYFSSLNNWQVCYMYLLKIVKKVYRFKRYIFNFSK